MDLSGQKLAPLAGASCIRVDRSRLYHCRLSLSFFELNNFFFPFPLAVTFSLLLEMFSMVFSAILKNEIMDSFVVSTAKACS